MSIVSYDSKRIIPGPFVNVTKNYQTTADGEKIGSLFNINVIGTIVAFKGSPTSSGTFHTLSTDPTDEVISNDSRLGALIRKKEAVRDLFSQDGLSMEWQSMDGTAPMKCNPRITSLDFRDGLWYNRIDYTIQMEADIVYVNGTSLGEDSFTEYINSASESWVIETDERPEDENQPRTYRLTHSLSAQGKRFFDETGTLVNPAWKQARDWVLPKLGFDAQIALSSGVNNLPSYYQGLNHVRSENIDENGGNYSVTETWILSSGTALEDFTVNSRETLDDGLVRVSIDGQIVGLEERDSNLALVTSKIDNAQTKFDNLQSVILSRAQTYSGHNINPIPNSKTIAKNPTTGTINYTFDYDDRPTNLITGTKSESIVMQDSFLVDEFAAIGVLGRAAGPVLQDLNSKKAITRSLTIELVFSGGFVGNGTATERLITNHPSNSSPQATEIAALIAAAEPVNAGALNNVGAAASVSYISDQGESWDIVNGRYSRNISWTYE